MAYASDGIMTSITDRNGNTTEFVYEGTPFTNSYRRLLQVKVPKGLSAPDGFRTVTFRYTDPVNPDNVTEVEDDLGNIVISTYDSLDRVVTTTDARTVTTTFNYIDGLLQEIELPANNGSASAVRKTNMLYDSRGRMTELLQDDSSTTQQTRVKYVFDVLSQVSQLVREKGGVERAYTSSYDQFGRVINTQDPLNRTKYFNREAHCLTYREVAPRYIERQISRDLLCRISEVKVGEDPLYSNGEEVLEGRELREFHYDELGRLVLSKQTRPAVLGEAVSTMDIYGVHAEERAYLYDELSRLVQMTYQDGRTMLWEYDDVGNVTKITDTEGKVTEYSYYRDNLLYQATVKRTGQSDRVFSYTYDDAGRLDQIVYPAATGITATFRDGSTPGTGFDGNGNLRFLRYEKTGLSDPLRSFEWTYDDSNNRQSMLDVDPTRAVKWEYGFDWLDRLVTVKKAQAADVGSLGTPTLQREYVFDESDNRIFFDDYSVGVNGVTYHYIYDEADQIEEILIYSAAAGHRVTGDFTTLETFLHDDDGNMIKRIIAATSEEIEFTWSDFDRLERVESNQNGRMQDARYGVDGLRHRKLDRNGNNSEEYGVGIATSASAPGTANSTAPSISYIQGHMILGAEIDAGSGLQFVFHLPDALGTVRDVVDETGAVIKSFEFDEYGNPISSSGTGTASPKTWIGGLSVNDDTADSGMFNMGHRNYAAGVLGRFISRDPIGHAGGLNLYSYPTNPVTFTDSSGLGPIAWWKRAIKVYQYLDEGGKRLVGQMPAACGKKGGKNRRLEQLEALVEEATSRARPRGESPRNGFGVHMEGSTTKNRQDAASHFSADGNAVDHGSHSHPNTGTYAEVNFEHQGFRGHFYDFAAGFATVLLAPSAGELVQLKSDNPCSDISLKDVIAAGALDVLQVVDPGISDFLMLESSAFPRYVPIGGEFAPAWSKSTL